MVGIFAWGGFDFGPRDGGGILILFERVRGVGRNPEFALQQSSNFNGLEGGTGAA